MSTPDPKPKVRYCNPVPETLRKWCDAHAHQIQEVDSGHGYAFESRSGFDAALAGMRARLGLPGSRMLTAGSPIG